VDADSAARHAIHAPRRIQGPVEGPHQSGAPQGIVHEREQWPHQSVHGQADSATGTTGNDDEGMDSRLVSRGADAVMGVAPEFEMLLPALVMEAEFQDANLVLHGTDWSLSAVCAWRWVSAEGEVCSPARSDAADCVWDLVGERIVSVSWNGPRTFGLDPTLQLESGGSVTILSDASFDTWVLSTPNLVFVGPLEVE